VTEREEVLTERLLTVLAEHLGQEPGEWSQSASLLRRSPAMLAAWSNATSRLRGNERQRRALPDRQQSVPERDHPLDAGARRYQLP